MIDILEIERRCKTYALGIASPDDFACRVAGEVDPSVLITDPTISLYCLDHDAHRALFVQVPADVDITTPPFLYMAQCEHAQRLYAVPYDILHTVAAGISAPDQLIFIHTSGRAGSTLLSKAFGELESVTSLSEPDVYSQAAALRQAGVEDHDLRRILRDATLLLFNPAFTADSALHVVKFRSFAIQVADLLADAFPGAHTLLTYRDLAGSIRSGAAFGLDEMPPEDLLATAFGIARMTPLLAAELQLRTDLDPIEVLGLIWLSTMQAHSRLQAQGLLSLAVRYEALLADPRRALATVLAFCGLPVERAGECLRAFERDSQAGSPLSRESAAERRSAIGADRWARLAALVRRYGSGDPVLPAGALAIA